MGYETSKIYRLLCDDGCYYYGSTITSLKERLWHHKESAKTMQSRVYTHIRTIGLDKVTIELVEALVCKDRKELRMRENIYIQSNKDDPKCLNTLRAYTSEEEKATMEKTRQQATTEHRKEVVRAYYEAHKDEIRERQHQYYNDNKETLNQKSREYNEANALAIKGQRKNYYDENRERLSKEKRDRRAQNPEFYKQKAKEYREANRERILAHKRAAYAASRAERIGDAGTKPSLTETQ